MGKQQKRDRKQNRKSFYKLASIIGIFVLAVGGGLFFFGAGSNGITMSLLSSVPGSAPSSPALKALPALGAGTVGGLFDVTLTIPEKYEAISPGEEMLLSLELTNFGTGETTASITYLVTEQDGGKLIYVEQEERVVQTQDQFLKQLELQTLPAGWYNVYAYLVYDDASAVASGKFQVTLS